MCPWVVFEFDPKAWSKMMIYYRGKAKYLIGVILDPVLAVFHDFGKKCNFKSAKKNIICIFKIGKTKTIFAPEKV